MSDPREDVTYSANLILTIMFDDIEFTSNVKNYEFEAYGDYKYEEDEIHGIARCCYAEEYYDVFEDVDLEITVTSVKKL